MRYVEIGHVRYPAKIVGFRPDTAWDGRESKSISLQMSPVEAAELFTDGVSWNSVNVVPISIPRTDESGNLVLDENGDAIIDVGEAEEVFDNSEFCVAGDITDHRDGTVTVKMGKYTTEEMLLMEVLQ